MSTYSENRPPTNTALALLLMWSLVKLDVRGGELPDIDVSEGLDEWDEEEGIGQEEIIEPEEMDVDEYN